MAILRPFSSTARAICRRVGAVVQVVAEQVLFGRDLRGGAGDAAANAGVGFLLDRSHDYRSGGGSRRPHSAVTEHDAAGISPRARAIVRARYVDGSGALRSVCLRGVFVES